MMLIIRDRHETPVVTSSGSANPQPNGTAASLLRTSIVLSLPPGCIVAPKTTTAQSGTADVPEDHEALWHAGNVLAECRRILRQPKRIVRDVLERL